MAVDPDLIVCHNEDKNQPLQGVPFFCLQNANTLYSPELLGYADFLQKVVFRIARRPKNLIAHIQRIYLCFQKDLNEQLFAAIVDFLVILNKRGSAISWRILVGTKSRLSPAQFTLIKDYLKDEFADPLLLKGNQYSICSRGITGVSELVRHIDTQGQPEHDPLDIALDHIEYSQLEEAKQVLEKAVLKQPKRMELQHELLALYRSTRDPEGFNNMLSELKRLELDIIDEWNQLNNFFEGQNGNG
ncbi:MAG: hypothetical protein PHU14_01505 [Methylovulum sp.]|nr:hypothetical protein [Methylovulum sp.]